MTDTLLFAFRLLTLAALFGGLALVAYAALGEVVARRRRGTVIDLNQWRERRRAVLPRGPGGRAA